MCFRLCYPLLFCALAALVNTHFFKINKLFYPQIRIVLLFILIFV